MALAKDYDSYKRVHVEIANQVATLYMYWPDGLRTTQVAGLGSDVELFHSEFAHALGQLRNDDAVRIVVLRGPGERYFLSTFAGVEDSPQTTRVIDTNKAFHMTQDAPEILEPILKMPKPVIAMVNGDALGIGATIAMACDLVIAREDAYITDSHMAAHYWMKNASLQQGTVPGDGGAVFWPLDMSLHLAKEYLFTARPVTARELADMHVINRAVPQGELQACVDDMVQLLLDRPAWALGWAKVAINKAVMQRFELTMDLGIAYEVMFQHQRALEKEKGITEL